MISPFMLVFSKPEDVKEYLILNGQPAKTDETYIDIYSKAKKTIYIVDNYVSIKTLRLLQNAQTGVSVIVFTDNPRNQLHARGMRRGAARRRARSSQCKDGFHAPYILLISASTSSADTTRLAWILSSPACIFALNCSVVVPSIARISSACSLVSGSTRV